MPTPQAGEEVVVMQTNHGKIVIGFLEDKAPLHVANFKKLATEGFYNGLKFLIFWLCAQVIRVHSPCSWSWQQRVQL
jgi:hypothetical protein